MASSDFTIASGGSVTLGENVTWVQSGGNNWVRIYGKLTVEKGAQMQIGPSIGTHFGSTAEVIIKEGGLIQVLHANGGYWDEVGTWKVDGTVNMGEKWMLAGIREIPWSGEAELSIDGILSFGGFTAQKAGTSENKEGAEVWEVW